MMTDGFGRTFGPKFAAAFVAAQSELTGVVKDAKNPHFRSTYATLEAVTDALRPVLAKHKLAYMQFPGTLTEVGLTVQTIVFHECGEGAVGNFTVPIAKRDPQGAGSAITYACRYALMAAFGLPPTDDDGEAAMDRSEGAKRIYAPSAHITDGPNKPVKVAAKPKPAEPDAMKNADNVLAYSEAFKFAVGQCRNADELQALWKEQSFNRDRLNILKSDDDYERLAGFCKDQRETFPAAQ